MNDNITQFGKGHVENGRFIITPVRTLRQSSMMKCRFSIMDPSHYREDESCKCDDVVHRIIMCKEWGYHPKDFRGIPLRKPEQYELPLNEA